MKKSISSQSNLIIMVVLIFQMNHFVAYSQCACLGGASVGGLTPVGGTTNIGILQEGNLRAISFYSYSKGNEYYSGDSHAEQGAVKSFNSSYLGIQLGYGIFDDLTIDAELGYYLSKSQEFSENSISGSGFSHFTLYGKYNAYSSFENEFEWTVGIGGRIPLIFEDQNLPQNIQTTTGAYGGILLSYLHKGFKSDGLHLILVNRAELNAENKNTYKYGNSLTSSLFVTKSIFDKLIAMIEIRGDLRLRDSKYGEKNFNSGWKIIIISPQLNYSIDDFNISAYYDFPVYKYYNGNQLTNKNSVGLALTWQSDFLKY